MPLESGLIAKISQAVREGDVATVGRSLINYDGTYQGYGPLHIACAEGLLDAANLLLRLKGIDINQKSGPVSCTPLRLASSAGQAEAVRLLLKLEGIDVNAADTNGLSPLYVAASKGFLDVVKLLVENGANVNCKKPDLLITPLIIACARGHADIASYLLDQPGIDVNHSTKVTNANNPQSVLLGNATAYFVASLSCPLWLVEKLIAKGVDVALERKIAEQKNQTIDILAQQGKLNSDPNNSKVTYQDLDQYHAVKKLEDKYLNSSRKTITQNAQAVLSSFSEDKENYNCIQHPSASYQAVQSALRTEIRNKVPLIPPVEPTLIQLPRNNSGFSTNGVGKDTHANTANTNAYIGQERVFMRLEPKLLVKIFEAVEGKDIPKIVQSLTHYNGAYDGYPPLHIVCAEGLVDAVKLLLTSQKFDINQKSGSMLDTPLKLACAEEQTEIVEFLLSLKYIDVNVRDILGQSPLHLAAANGYLEIVRLLLSHPKIEINSKDHQAKTALDVANQAGKFAVATVLVDHGAIAGKEGIINNTTYEDDLDCLLDEQADNWDNGYEPRANFGICQGASATQYDSLISDSIQNLNNELNKAFEEHAKHIEQPQSGLAQTSKNTNKQENISEPASKSLRTNNESVQSKANSSCLMM